MTNEPSNATARPQRKALGRGLNALLESRTAPTVAPAPPAATPAPEPQGQAVGGRSLRQLPLDSIEPNPDQPRKVFGETHLEELADSIRTHGLLQPVIVAPIGPPETATRFRLVAGERRWRAARLAQLSEVPALVQETPKDRSLELALIENLQREDLNPIEAAQAFDRLAQDFELTHEEIAARTGKDRATITNFLRLLRLPAEVQVLVGEGKISMGHARALLGLRSADAQRKLAGEIVARDLSVRQVEKLVAQTHADPEKQPATKKEKQWDANVRAALHDLERRLGTKVRLTGSTRRGKILIEYYSETDLLRIYDAIAGPAQPAD